MLELLEYKNDGVMCHSYLLWNSESLSGIEVQWPSLNAMGQVPHMPQEDLMKLWTLTNAQAN